MKVAVLGGSFDPPHKGHVAVAKKLIKLFKLNEIWLMPCYNHPFNKILSKDTDRLEMTKYLEGKNIKISGFELERKNTSYTIDTLKSLAKMYPKTEFFWIIGSDQIRNFTKWKEWKEILTKYRLIIIPRNTIRKEKKEIDGLQEMTKTKGNIVIVGKNDFSPIYISSTEIRNRIRNNRPISNMVSKNVEKYIREHDLYK